MNGPRARRNWRQDRAAGKASATLKPQQNDRPEVAARAAATQKGNKP